jgi:zinc protease
MRIGSIVVILLVCTISLLGCSLPGLSGLKRGNERQPLIGEEPVNKFVLDNGLTVLIRESHASPVVTLDIWVNTGSINEPRQINGVSHFLEHMMFKGTETHKVGEIDRIVEGVGGMWNAGTSKDFTHYYLTVGSPHTDVGLDVLADVMMHSSLDPGELEKERKVILEEYYRKQDNPGALLYEKIYDIAYASSPLKQPVLGVPDSISTITRQQMFDYYHRYYTPDNMALVVAGDVDTQTLLNKIRSTFDGFDRRFTPYTNPPIPEERNSGKLETISKEIKETYFALIFPGPSIQQPDDVYAMDLLLYVLGEGRSSRLQQEIKEKKRLVSTIGVTYPTHKLKGVFIVSATLKRENLDQTREAILAELEKARTKGVKRSELAKAKKLLTNVYYFSNETTAGQCASIGFYYTLSGDMAFEKNYLDNIRKQTVGDLRRVAKKYLRPDALDQVIIEPPTETPEPTSQ